MKPETGVEQAIRLLAANLRAEGIEEAATDARILVASALGVDRAGLVRDPMRPLGPSCDLLAAWAERRVAREPVSRILGRREFWGLTFAVGRGVLDPRPDSETLVEAALQELAGRRKERLRILDLGVGSGALLCALLTELPEAVGVGVDSSRHACGAARENVAKLGLSDRARIEQCSWREPLSARFDLIVSNPPYVRTGDIGALDPEVRLFDPVEALDGGPDGLEAFRALGPIAARLLDAKGAALFEIGVGQSEAVMNILAASGLPAIGVRADLAGRDRVVVCGPALQKPRSNGDWA